MGIHAQVTDDNRTAVIKDSGQALDGCGANGGEVLVIMEGTDFEDRTHRQIVDTQCPNAGTIHYEMVLDPHYFAMTHNPSFPMDSVR